MPLNSPTHNSNLGNQDGCLYVVGTPIGNKDDITLRALNLLREVDIVAAEDTRHTGRFLLQHKIKRRLVSYHEHNKNARTTLLINKLKQGFSGSVMFSMVFWAGEMVGIEEEGLASLTEGRAECNRKNGEEKKLKEE